MLSVPNQSNAFTTPTRAILGKKFAPSPYVSSPTTEELKELKSKQSNTRACQRRPKYKVDAVNTRVTMIAEFLDKENDDPKVQQEHIISESDTFHDKEKLSQAWKEKSKELKAMFDDVDAFELSTSESPEVEEPAEEVVRTEEADILVSSSTKKRKPKSSEEKDISKPSKTSTKSRRRR